MEVDNELFRSYLRKILQLIQQEFYLSQAIKLEARVTNSNRKVVKIQKDNGNSKYSATQYPNGTVVEMKVTKRK